MPSMREDNTASRRTKGRTNKQGFGMALLWPANSPNDKAALDNACTKRADQSKSGGKGLGMNAWYPALVRWMCPLGLFLNNSGFKPLCSL